MARKPAKMYRRLKGQAYTRRKYTGGVPNNRIMRFHMGNRKAAEADEFPVILNMTVDESCQVRHTALEAARVISNATIRAVAGQDGYALRVHVYPHHILRENKQATGPVQIVYPRECAVHSARTLELLLAASVAPPSFQSQHYPRTSWLLRTHFARPA